MITRIEILETLLLLIAAGCVAAFLIGLFVTFFMRSKPKPMATWVQRDKRSTLSMAEQYEEATRRG